ncbi:CHAT domain-containing protein [Streptomyces doebereineriae]|uniref:CHAT domain-containing protein n=1 Tax=Streptomyces doebereineriae TaxID=3075528 RepID=A0ABU2VIG3_9ACTN|nr:CHAT domain-containing protein [Streptomyces sp. DSM 41640]MDT0485377.1 CHAT domain-containing protein [Streptomyces sp. DSM 41640]
MTRQTALEHLARLVNMYERLRQGPELAAVTEFVQAVLSEETEQALTVLHGHMALERIVAEREVDVDSLDIESINAYGWGQFLRAEVLQEGEDSLLRSQAMLVLSLAYQYDPALVPEQTLPAFIAGSPEKALVLGSSKLDEYARSGDAAALFLAVELLQGATAAVGLEASDREEWFEQLVSGYSCLSAHHLMLYLRTRNAEQLDQAIDAARLAVAHSPESVWPELADQLSDCLRVKAEAFGDLDTIEEAVTFSRTAVMLSGLRGHIGPRFMSRLAVALRVAFVIAPGIDRIDEAVEFGRKAVEATPADDPNWAARAGNHATALTLRFNMTARTDDIDEAIEWHTRAAAHQRPEDPDPGMAHSNLCEALRLKYLPTTNVAGLTRAVDSARRAVEVTPSQHAHYALYCGNAAAALISLLELTGDGRLVEEALHMARAAFDVTPVEHAEFHRRLGTLVGALQETVRRTGDTEVFDECLDLSRRGISAVAASHPDRPGMLLLHASVLRDRYLVTGQGAYLDECVTTLRNASESVTPDRFGKARILRTLVGVWKEAIAAKAATPRDVYRVVAVIRGLLETAEPESAEHGELLVALADALVFLYRLDPRPELLDEAIGAASELQVGTTDHHVHLTEYLIAQSDPFLRLYESCSDPAALDAAIRTLKRAHSLLVGLDHQRARVAQRLGELLPLAAGHQGPTVLTGAIRYAREAVALFPPGTPQHEGALTALSSALQDHASRTRNRRHLDEALGISRALVEEAPRGTDEHDRYRVDLGLGLAIQARLDGDPKHLDEAVSIFRDLAADRTIDDVRRSRRLFNLGHLLEGRYRATGRRDDLPAAVDAFGEAARLPNASPLQRMSAARRRAALDAERGDWEAAAESYALAVEQLPFAVGPRLTREAQEAMLPDTTGVATAAAACALELDDALKAVELLEAGRATLISQALDLRGPLSAVHEHAPHLAAQWQQLRQESSVPGQETLVQRHRRATRWDGLRREIIELPGVAEFLAPSSRRAVTDTAADGPVVIVNSHASRTDAILIANGDIEAIRLPASAEDAERAVNRLLRVQPKAGTEAGAARSMSGILEWMWDTVTQPVLHTLGMDTVRTTAEAPRLWWCPTGLFTLLPVAAAGHHSSTDTVLDRVTSSFTPTLRALTHARRPRPAHRDTFLSVAVPDTAGLPRLVGVATETGILRGRFPDGVFLSGADATAPRVLARLADASRVHFACHGMSDPYSPSSSCLILHEGSELRVTDVSRLDLDAEVAFLSACSTARGGHVLPDEAITIASAFLLAGYRDVVATLWPIYDAEAPHLAESFYQTLTPTAGPSRALHEAIHRTRTRIPDRPDVWSSYVHYGP